MLHTETVGAFEFISSGVTAQGRARLINEVLTGAGRPGKNETSFYSQGNSKIRPSSAGNFCQSGKITAENKIINVLPTNIISMLIGCLVTRCSKAFLFVFTR